MSMRKYLQKLAFVFATVAILAGQGMALADENQPKIQIGILLDGSGSMDGLIAQTQKQIWKIVNELAKATKGGVVPALEIAVYEHGKSNLSAESGYLQQLVPLVADLDRVSGHLFEIVARGSEEFTGWAIQSAIRELQWSDNPGDYKAIFIAGNETMKQGPVNVVTAIEEAKKRGILVNTIHAKGGSSHDANRDFWSEAATLGDGGFAEIVLDYNFITIVTPLDDEILSLNDDLNNTYVPFGTDGMVEYEKLIVNDENASSVGSLVDRGLTKAGPYYDSYVSKWDIVGAALAYKEGIEAFLLTLKNEDFPKEMQEMTLEEKIQHIEDKALERKAIQEAIFSLSKIRQKIVDHKLENLEGSNMASVDKAMVEILHRQLDAQGFQIK